MNAPRRYCDGRDLEAMIELLKAGRKAANGTYYIHRGDLSWWLYYPPLAGDFWDQIYLWDDPRQPGRVLGWALFSPDWVGIDVYIQPELRGCETGREMYVWAEGRAEELARQNGKQALHVLWVFHDDDILNQHYTDRGFQRNRGYVHMIRPLEGKIDSPHLPDGFSVRSCRGEEEVTARAKAQYGAFESRAPFDQYLHRFTSFMRSPVYDPNLDIIAVNESGEVGAFCIVWTDSVNQVGLFEPMGTHPGFQRKGLGAAVMREGMRQLQERGMRSAIVSTFEDHPGAIHFYESAGFRVLNKLGTYERDV